MKRMLWTLLTITLLAGVSGCCWPPHGCRGGGILGHGPDCPNADAGDAAACTASCAGGCQQCGGAGCESCGGGESYAQADGEAGDVAGCEACGGAGCEACGGTGCRRCGRASAVACGLVGCGRGAGRPVAQFTPGPPSAAITYPYYTVRGPRDFLAENPPSIGP